MSKKLAYIWDYDIDEAKLKEILAGKLTIGRHETLGMLDSPEDILANKITAAIDRQEPKDMADIWGFCCRRGISLTTAINDAHSKAAGIFPADLARVLCSTTKADWEAVLWIEPPEAEKYLADLQKLGDSLIILK